MVIETARHLPAALVMTVLMMVILTSSHQLRTVRVIGMLLLIYTKIQDIAYDGDVSSKAYKGHVCRQTRQSLIVFVGGRGVMREGKSAMCGIEPGTCGSRLVGTEVDVSLELLSPANTTYPRMYKRPEVLKHHLSTLASKCR
ncbi:hypothetical protein IG631_06468 [Alternaria alternata]|nr:hypothetical protein IG631_06468 [Alternaria alternata]